MQIIEQITNVVGVINRDLVTSLQQHAASSQAQLGRHDQQFSDGGVDPAYVTGQEPPPETMTHQQIWDAVQNLDQQAMWNVLSCWSQVSTSLTSAFQLAGIGISRAMQGRLEGEAATAAANAVSAFVSSGERIGDVAQSVAMRLDTMYYAAQALVAAVPAPVASVAADPDNPAESVLPWLVSGEKSRGDSEAATQARNLAIAAVNTTYLPVFPPAGADVPTFVAPQETGGGQPDSGSQGPGSGGPTAGGSPSTAGPSSATATPSDESVPETVGDNSSNGTSQDDSQPSDSESAQTEPQSDATAPASATTPTTSASPAATPNTGSQSPGNVGLGGASRADIGGIGSGGAPGIPSAGNAVPGRPGNPTVMNAGSAGGSGASAARSGPMGPMMPGAGARKKDDDDTHQSPDYLRRVQDELAAQAPAIAPVIGDADTALTMTTSSQPDALPTPQTESISPRSLFDHTATLPTPKPATTMQSPTEPPAHQVTSGVTEDRTAPSAASSEPDNTSEAEGPAAPPPSILPIAGTGPWDIPTTAAPTAADERSEPRG
ncbi:hypothetical protein [Nocardia salmonicida]|uniref:hypothetical protein n=1 Tax=Nocardia salmonicida TaxID=53431 RepID=UPI000A4D6397|nr:hypothetical protein [Nocardia salmonicida]